LRAEFDFFALSMACSAPKIFDQVPLWQRKKTVNRGARGRT